jgi:hypothetical protein
MAAFVAVAAPNAAVQRGGTLRSRAGGDGAATLIARVERNMAATRGYPVIVVRVDR